MCLVGDRTDQFFEMGRRNLANEISVLKIVRSIRIFDMYMRKHSRDLQQIMSSTRKVAVHFIEPEESPEEQEEEELKVEPMQRSKTMGAPIRRRTNKKNNIISSQKDRRFISNESIRIENVDKDRRKAAEDESSLDSASISLSELSRLEDIDKDGTQTTIRKTMTQAVIKKKTV